MESLSETGDSEAENYEDELSSGSECHSQSLNSDSGRKESNNQIVKFEDGALHTPQNHSEKDKIGESGKSNDQTFRVIAVTGKQIDTEGNNEDKIDDIESNDDDMFDHKGQMKFDWQQIFLQEKMMGEPQSIP